MDRERCAKEDIERVAHFGHVTFSYIYMYYIVKSLR